MKKVSAVIVTHNRLDLLKQCINAIRNQSIPISSVIVVDNNSTDGTSEWLDAQTDLYVIHQPNLGGAGGFNRGMKEAYNLEADYIWVMDDDGLPSHNCLENLLSFAENSDYEVISPLIVSKESSEQLAFVFPHPFLLDTVIKTRNEIEQTFNKKVDGITHLFNGILLKKEVIDKVGFPKSEMFIWGDEKEYHDRLLRNKIKITTIFNSIYIHPKDRMVYTVNKGRWVYNYGISWKSYCVYRNDGYRNRQKGQKGMRYIYNHLAYFFCEQKSIWHKLKMSWFFIKAYSAGYRNDFSKKVPF